MQKKKKTQKLAYFPQFTGLTSNYFLIFLSFLLTFLLLLLFLDVSSSASVKNWWFFIVNWYLVHFLIFLYIVIVKMVLTNQQGRTAPKCGLFIKLRVLSIIGSK